MMGIIEEARARHYEEMRAKMDATWELFQATENGDVIIEITKADGSTTRLKQTDGIWWHLDDPKKSAQVAFDVTTLPALQWSNDDYRGRIERHLQFGEAPYSFEAVVLGSSDRNTYRLLCYPDPSFDSRWVDEHYEATDVGAAIAEAVQRLQHWVTKIQDDPDMFTRDEVA